MEWKEYTLEEVCQKITDGSHFSPTGQGEGYPMFSVKDMLEYGFDYTNCKRISRADFDNMVQNDCVPQKDDVLVAKDGSFLKSIFLCKETKEEAILSSIAIFRPNPKKIFPAFLCYLLKSPEVYNYIALNCVSGSALPRIVLKDFKKVSLTIPASLDDQKRIAAILSSLDAKIENNTRINANLEAQAKALYKSWFVDFEPFGGSIPEDWKEGVLTDVADITMGQSPRGESYNAEGVGVLFYQGCSDFGVRFPSVRMFTTEPSRYATQNSVLMSVRAPVGFMNVAMEKCCIGRGLASIKSKYDYDSYILYLMQSLQKELEAFNGDGTVFGSINKKSLESICIIVPSMDAIDLFNQKVKPLDAIIKSNALESQHLAQLRDTLLPKLMKGEIVL